MFISVLEHCACYNDQTSLKYDKTVLNCCVQETKWKDTKARQIRQMSYNGTSNTKNRFGMIKNRK